MNKQTTLFEEPVEDLSLYPFITATISPIIPKWIWEYHDYDFDRKRKTRFEIDHNTAMHEVKLHEMGIIDRSLKDDTLKITYK